MKAKRSIEDQAVFYLSPIHPNGDKIWAQSMAPDRMGEIFAAALKSGKVSAVTKNRIKQFQKTQA